MELLLHQAVIIVHCTNWKIWSYSIAANQPNNEWGTAAQVTYDWLMIQNVNAMLVWKCHLAGRVFESNQPNVWRIEGSNNGTTFTTLYMF